MPSITPFDDSPLKKYPSRAYGDQQKCFFCEKGCDQAYVFQGEPICWDCNLKVLERVKNLLSL